MYRRASLAVLALLALQLWNASGADAHSVLVSSTPDDGQVLAAAPPSVDLEFTEAVDPAATVLDLVDSRGHRYPASGIHVAHETHIVGELPTLPAETYRLAWRTASADDRHETSGVIVFRVGPGAAPQTTVPPDPLPRPGEALLRWVILVCTGGLVGGLLLVAIGNRRGSRKPLADDVGALMLGVGLTSGALAAVAAPMLMSVQAGGVDRAVRLLPSPFAVRSLLSEAALLVLLGITLCQRHFGISRMRNVMAGGAVAVFATASALLGHAATSGPRTALEASHLVAALAWFGTVVTLPVVAIAAARRPGLAVQLRGELPNLLRAFGSIAVASLGWLIVSGLLLTGDSASTVDSLLTSVFGRILLVKLALALVAGLLGLHLHRRLRSTSDWAGMRALGAEALVLLGVLACVGALLSTAPPQGRRWQPGTTLTGTPTAAGESDGLLESVRISPNVPGHDFVDVDVFNSRRPAPAAITGVRVRLGGPNGESVELSARMTTGGTWVAPTDALDRPGSWTVIVLVERSGLPVVAARYGWVVSGRIGGPAHKVLSVARAAPIAGGAAAAVGALVLLALCVAGLRRRHPAGSTPAVIAEPIVNAEAGEAAALTR